MDEELSARLSNGEEVWLRLPSEKLPVCVTRVEGERVICWRADEKEQIVFRATSCHWEPPFQDKELKPLMKETSLSLVEVKKGKIIDSVQVPDYLRRQVTRNGTKRVHFDRGFSFGDGGHELLTFPIYTAANVLREEHRVSLLQALIAEGARRKDFQSSIVEDIIDPNLCPNRLNRGRLTAQQWHLKLIRETWAARNPEKDIERFFDVAENYHFEDDKSEEIRYQDKYFDMKDDCPPAAYAVELRYKEEFDPQPIPARVELRESFNWIPVDVQVDANGKCKFLGHISMFPRTPQTEAAYEGFERVLEQMIPAFRILNCAPEKEGVMQVVVKAQRYHLDEPNQCYKGHWHKEGCDTDRIVATGVYYVDIGPDLIGGAVKFRAPGEPPSEGYQRSDVKVDLSVPAEQNGILVFANSVPHRVRLMGNKGTESQSRTFINFFVVDPNRPLDSAGHFYTEGELRRLLKSCVEKTTGKTVPRDVMGLILGHLNLWKSMETAKAFRTKAREAMKATRSGPGFYCTNYGNCGVQVFTEDVRLLFWNRREEIERVKDVTDSSHPEETEDNKDEK